MFKFLKDKLKKAVDNFTKGVEKEAEEQAEAPVEGAEQVSDDAGSPVDMPDQDIEDEIEEITEDVAVDKTRYPGETVQKVKQEIEDALEDDPDEDDEIKAEIDELSGSIDTQVDTHDERSGSEKEPVRYSASSDTDDVSDHHTAGKEDIEKTGEEYTKEDTGQDTEEDTTKETKASSEEGSKKESKGFLGRFKRSVVDAVTKSSINEDQFNDLFWDLEMILLENNVAVEVIDKIRDDLRSKLVDQKVMRGSAGDVISKTLKTSIEDLFSVKAPDIIDEIRKSDHPYVIAFIGINGSGKTTTIAKITHMLSENGITCCLAAADTFRAAAIQQLEEHANNLKVKLIKHDYGADPAAVAFDAVKYARSKKLGCVLIDTAGRLHSNTNLIDEMKKIMRIAKPDMKIFVGESITGNDCVEQAKKFDDAVGIDGIILSKADIDEKGGAAISVSYVTGKPIMFLGTGQGYSDIKKFEPEEITKEIF